MTFKALVQSITKTSHSISDKVNIPWYSSKGMIEARGSTAYIVFTVCIAVFTDIFLYGVIVPVMPFSFTERMGVDKSDTENKMSQSLGVYSAGLIVASFIFGYVCDKTSQRRWLMILGMIIAIVSIVIQLVAKSVPLFLIGRLITGLSAGAVWTVGLSLLANTAKPDAVAYLMGYPGIGMTMGLFLGPLLGGVLYNQTGYYGVWYLCFGLLGFDIALQVFMIEKRNLPRKLAKFTSDAAGNDGGHDDDPEVDQAIQAAHEVVKETSNDDPNSNKNESEDDNNNKDKKKKKRETPTMIKLLKIPRVCSALWMTFALSWAMTSLDTNMPTHLNNLFNFDSLGSGLVFLAIAVPSLAEPLIGHVVDRVGPRYISSVACLLMGMLLILLRLPDRHTVKQIVAFCAILTLCGCCIACIFPIMTSELTIATTKAERKNPGCFGKQKGYGQVYGLFNVAFSLGALIGPFESAGAMTNSGWGTMTLSLGIIMFFSAIPAILFTGGNLVKRFSKKYQQKEKERQAALSSSPSESGQEAQPEEVV